MKNSNIIILFAVLCLPFLLEAQVTVQSLHLQKIGIVMKRAKYFITCNELPASTTDWVPERLKQKLIAESVSKNKKLPDTQLSLFADYKPVLY